MDLRVLFCDRPHPCNLHQAEVPFNIQEDREVASRTVYSAALKVVGIATCGGTGSPRSSRRKCRMSFEASIGEPPPTEMIVSALRSLKTCTPFLMSAIGLCWLISENVPPWIRFSFRSASIFEMTSVWVRSDTRSPLPDRAHLLPKAPTGDYQDFLSSESLQNRDKGSLDGAWAVVNSLECLSIGVKPGDR